MIQQQELMLEDKKEEILMLAEAMMGNQGKILSPQRIRRRMIALSYLFIISISFLTITTYLACWDLIRYNLT